MPTAGIEPATSSLPWMRATYCAKSAKMCVYRTRRLHMAVYLWLSHRLSMLVILVYHISCRCARENLKIFRFSKGKRGLGAKTPFSVFWRRPKYKKDKKNTFRCFSYYNVSDVSDKPARSSADKVTSCSRSHSSSAKIGLATSATSSSGSFTNISG